MTQQELRDTIAASIYTNVSNDIDGDELRDLMIEMVGGSGATSLVYSSIVSSPVPIFGNPEGVFTNGSPNVSGGAGAQFDNDTEASGLSTEGTAYVFALGECFELNISGITPDTAEIYEHYNLTVDPEKTSDLGANWSLPTGSYTMYAFANSVPSGMQQGVVLGYGNRISTTNANNQQVFVFGNSNTIEGTGGTGPINNSSMIACSSCTAKNGVVFTMIGSINCTVEGYIPFVVASESFLMGANTNTCSALFCDEGSVTEGDHVVAIGLRGGDDINIVGLQNVVILKKLMIKDPVPEHLDNAAALLAGLVIGQTYRTGDILKVVH